VSIVATVHQCNSAHSMQAVLAQAGLSTSPTIFYLFFLVGHTITYPLWRRKNMAGVPGHMHSSSTRQQRCCFSPGAVPTRAALRSRTSSPTKHAGVEHTLQEKAISLPVCQLTRRKLRKGESERHHICG